MRPWILPALNIEVISWYSLNTQGMGTVGATKMGDTFSTLKDQLIRGGQQKKETCQPAVNTKEVQADKVLL